MNRDRTQNLAWFTGGLRPGLRSAAAVPVVPGPTETTTTQELALAVQESIVPGMAPAGPSRGRHRRPSTSLLGRIRRTVTPPKY